MNNLINFGVSDLQLRAKENGVIICAHRGTCGGNVIQNTVMACENAILHGADMFEVDVILSKDGVFFGFHGGHEIDVLHLNEDIHTMTAEEIENTTVYNSLNLPVNAKLERLDFILKSLKDKCYINIDRSWFYGDNIIKYLENSDIKTQIIIKSPVESNFLKVIEKSTSRINYMPIIKTLEDFEEVQKYDLNLIAVELIFDTLDHDLVSKEFLAKMKEMNILTWANMITLDDKIVLSALLDDNNLILNGPSSTLHIIQDMGFNIVQTDWPHLIKTNIKK